MRPWQPWSHASGYHAMMAGKDMYSKLWNVIRMLLVLSHGQATVEIGF